MDHKSKLDEATIGEVEKAIAECKEAAGKDSNDVETLKAAISKLQTASMSIGKAVYGKGEAGSSTSEEKPAEETTKAETPEEGKEKK